MLYRVWNVVNRPYDTEVEDVRRLFFGVSSPGEACTVIQRLQKRREEDPTVITSECGFEILSGDGWTEWHDRHGHDVMDHFRLLLVGTQ